MIFIVFIMLVHCYADDQLILLMGRHLNIKHGLRITNKQSNKLNFIKSMSRNFIYASTFNVDKLHHVLDENSHLKTLVSIDEQEIKEHMQKIHCNVFWLLERDKAGPGKKLPYIPFNCNFWLASSDKQSFIQLDTVYQTREENNKIFNYYGNYSEALGLNALADIPSNSRRDVFGAYLILFAGDFDLCKFQTLCFHFLLLQDISQTLNFKLKKINSTEFKEVYGGNVDLKGVVASMHSHASNDFIAPGFKGWVSIYIKDSFGSHGDEWLAYSRPFSAEVWVCVAAWLAVGTIAVTIVSYYLLGRNKTLISDSMFAVLDSFCCQGGSVAAGREESRSCVLIPRILGQVLVPAYSAAIISFITYHIPSLPFQDLDGFLKDGTYRWSCLDVDFFTQTYFTTSGSEEMQAVAKLQHSEQDYPATYGDSIQRICKDKKFAFMAHGTFMEREWSPCKIVRIPSPIITALGAMPLSHKSPYFEAFKWALFKMHSTGSMSKMQTLLTWSPEVLQEVEFYPIDLPQIVVPYVILATGFLTATAILYLEMCFNFRREELSQQHRRPRKIIFRRIN